MICSEKSLSEYQSLKSKTLDIIYISFKYSRNIFALETVNFENTHVKA